MCAGAKLTSETNGPQSVASAASVASAGDLAHSLSLLNTFVYGTCVALYLKDRHDPIFDASWKKDGGFCISNPDTAWHSLNVCLYVMLAGSAILGMLYWPQRNTPGMEAANQILKVNMLSLPVHGLTHATQAAHMQKANDSASPEAPNVVGYLVLFSFWIGLLKATMPTTRFSVLLLPTLVVAFLQLQVPEEFGFTYAQVVLIFAFSCNRLMLPKEEKDFKYAAHAWIVGFPVTLIPWLESTQCSSFVRDYLAGHVVYDAAIPLLLSVWYLICVEQNKASSEQVKAKIL